jgi:putative ABC transport system permease protein
MVSRYPVTIVFNDDDPPWADNPPITVDEAREIGRLPSIRRTVVGLGIGAELSHGQQRVRNVQVAGRGLGWTAFTQGTIVAGRDMIEADVRASAPVVLLSVPLTEALFGPLDALGRTIRISGVPFEVIGVFDLADNIFASIAQNIAIMPYSSAIKHLNADDEQLGVLTVPMPGMQQDVAIDEVITLLRTRRGLTASDSNNFAVVRQEQVVNAFNRFSGAIFAVMIALSSVALMVGGVGVIAIMMIAVTERTREIGIRKAVGATRREILWQFLFEAVTVTVVGGIIGMAIGGGAAYVIAALTPVPASVPLSAILAALTMATVAGVLFGIWPAWRAARLDPVVALRYGE